MIKNYFKIILLLMLYIYYLVIYLKKYIENKIDLIDFYKYINIF